MGTVGINLLLIFCLNFNTQFCNNLNSRVPWAVAHKMTLSTCGVRMWPGKRRVGGGWEKGGGRGRTRVSFSRESYLNVLFGVGGGW